MTSSSPTRRSSGSRAASEGAVWRAGAAVAAAVRRWRRSSSPEPATRPTASASGRDGAERRQPAARSDADVVSALLARDRTVSRIFSAAEGIAFSRRFMSHWSSVSRRIGERAITVALRRSSSSSPISPK